MLKLIKSKVLGGGDKGAISFGVHTKNAAVVVGNDPQLVPLDFDVIDIDSASSSAQSSTERASLPDDQSRHNGGSVDVHKSFSTAYRSSAAAKEYTLIKTVNVGSTAKVQLAYHTSSGQHVALKIMKKSKQHIKYMNREVSIHKQLDHPNIVRLLDVIETPYHFVLVLEFLDGGDLFDLVPPNQGCSELQALRYMGQIVCAVAHMHARNVVHRDIKPENCVADNHGHIKLIDFGAASAADGASTPAGTIPYMAPEMFAVAPAASSSWDLKAIDVWALGVVYFTLLTGRFPWAVANEKKSPEFTDFIEGAIFHRYPWHKISPGSVHLLQRLLCVDIESRASVHEAQELVEAQLALAEAAEDDDLRVVARVPKAKMLRSMEEPQVVPC